MSGLMPPLSTKCGLCPNNCKRDSQLKLTLQCRCCFKTRFVHTTCLATLSKYIYKTTIKSENMNNEAVSKLFIGDNPEMVFFCDDCKFNKCLMCKRGHNMVMGDMVYIRFQQGGKEHWCYSRCLPTEKGIQLIKKGTRVYCAEMKKDNGIFTVEKVENNVHIFHLKYDEKKPLLTSTSSTKESMDWCTQEDTASLKTTASVVVLENTPKTTATTSYVASTDPLIIMQPDVVVFDRFDTKRIAIKYIEDRGPTFYEKAIDSLYSSILNPPQIDTKNMTLDTILLDRDNLNAAYLELLPQLAEQSESSMNYSLFDAYVRSVESLFHFEKSTSNPERMCTGSWVVSNILEDIVDIYNLSRSKNKNDKNAACILGYDGTLAVNNPRFNQSTCGFATPSETAQDNELMKKMINGTYSLSMMFKTLHEQVRTNSQL